MLLSFLINSQINKLNFHVAITSTDDLSAVCSDTITTVHGNALEKKYIYHKRLKDKAKRKSPYRFRKTIYILFH